MFFLFCKILVWGKVYNNAKVVSSNADTSQMDSDKFLC